MPRGPDGGDDRTDTGPGAGDGRTDMGPGAEERRVEARPGEREEGGDERREKGASSSTPSTMEYRPAPTCRSRCDRPPSTAPAIIASSSRTLTCGSTAMSTLRTSRASAESSGAALSNTSFGTTMHSGWRRGTVMAASSTSQRRVARPVLFAAW